MQISPKATCAVIAVTVSCAILIAIARLNAGDTKPAAPSVGTADAAGTARALTPPDYYRLRQRADNLFDSLRFTQAKPLYERLLQHFDGDGDVWARLGRCQNSADEHEKIPPSYEKAIELGFGNIASHAHQIAGAYYELGDHEKAFAWLERSLAAPHEDRRLLERDLRVQRLAPKNRVREIVGRLPAREFERDEGWRYDVTFFSHEIERMHYSPWRKTSRDDFYAAVHDLHERIPQLSDGQVVVELQRLATLIGDGHTSIRLHTKRTPVTPVPLQMYRFSDGLFIIDAPEKHHELIGSRIESIGSVPTDEVFRRLQEVTSHDNPMAVDWRGPYMLRVPAVLVNLGLAEEDQPIVMSLVDRSGERRRVTLSPESFEVSSKLIPARPNDAPAPPLHLENIEKTYWFKQLPEHKAVYVQFNQVQDERDETLSEFALRLRKFLDEHDVENLIVDVRHNSGGNTYLTIELLKTLIHFETTRDGERLFAIIGRNTYSACQNFVTEIDRLTDGIFVGEPTGGRPNSIGESTRVILPYSEVRCSISSRFWQTSWPTDRRIWIAPDVPVRFSSEDYFANRDPAIQAVMCLMQEQRQ